MGNLQILHLIFFMIIPIFFKNYSLSQSEIETNYVIRPLSF
jgi:hypothetical protein